MTRDPFAGLGTTKPSIGAAYVKPGQHLFEIVKLKYVNERNEAFIAELKTAESDTHDVGATISWVVSLKYDGALPDIKGFAMAVLGVAEAQASEVDADVLHNMINTDDVSQRFSDTPGPRHISNESSCDTEGSVCVASVTGERSRVWRGNGEQFDNVFPSSTGNRSWVWRA